MFNWIHNFIKRWKNRDNFTCVECGFEVPVYGDYMKNEITGEILCRRCFDKLLEEGRI